MSIKIRWGGNGAYKSSGCVQDDLIPFLRGRDKDYKNGRLVITNIRGFTLEKVLAVYPDLPPGSDILNLNMEEPGTMELLRFVLFWAPIGSLVAFDETQLIFLRQWTNRQIEKMYGEEGAVYLPEIVQEYRERYNEGVNRDYPTGWLDSWTRHRHWNFDVVLTTPNISFIHSDIRGTSEVAYRHANMAVLGIKGRYKEAVHDAQSNRPAPDAIAQIKKIQPKTFKCYDSTSSGIVQDTKAGTNILKSGKLLLALAFCSSAFVYAFSSGGLGVFADTHITSPNEAISEMASSSTQETGGQGSSVPPGDVPDSPDRSIPVVKTHPLQESEIIIAGSLSAPGKRIYLFRVRPPGRDSYLQTTEQIQSMGYQVLGHGDCYAELYFRGEFEKQIQATCGNFQRQGRG
jgi:zona occludens toxin